MTSDPRFAVLGAFIFQGWPTRRVLLPSGDKIICTICWDGTEPKRNIYDSNHNVFRLNLQNEIIWQVHRDDSIMPPDWWDTMHAIAKKNGRDGERAPFMYITLEYPDGSNNRADQSGSPPDEAIWTPDCTIWLSGSLSRDYILDPDTGIAKNMTPGFVRDW